MSPNSVVASERLQVERGGKLDSRNRANEPGKVSIVDYSPEHESAMLELFRRHFGNGAAARLRLQWRWQFDHNPFSAERPPLVSLLQTEQGEVVGALLAHPIPIRYHGQRGVALCGGGLAVDRAYRLYCLYLLRKHFLVPPGVSGGLVVPLRQLYERFGAVTVPVTRRRYTLTLRSDGARCRRLRGQLGALTRFVQQHTPAGWPRRGLVARCGARVSRCITPALLAKFRPKVTGGPDGTATRRRSLDIRVVERFGEAYDALWRSFSAGLDCTVERDSVYMNWRYVSCPGQHCMRLALYERDRLVAVAVGMPWVELDWAGSPCVTHLELVELIAEDLGSEEVKDLVVELVRRMDDEHHVDTVGSFAFTSRHHAVLEQLGFCMEESSRFAMLVNWSSDIAEQHLNQELSWYASAADTDCLLSCSV